MKKTFLVSIFSLTIFLVLGVALVHAQGVQTPPPDTSVSNRPDTTVKNEIKFGIPNPFKDSGINSLFDLVKAIVDKIILPVGGVLAVLSFIYSGFLYVMAQGRPAEITKANTALLYSAIGTAVLLGAWVLANAVCQTIHLLGGPICN